MTNNLPDRVPVVELRAPEPSIVTVARVVYILHGVSILIGIATGASIIGAFLFGWYAMFFALVVAGVGFILSWLLVGFAVWMVGFVVMGIWVGYRILRGWIRLSRGQTMPV